VRFQAHDPLVDATHKDIFIEGPFQPIPIVKGSDAFLLQAFLSTDGDGSELTLSQVRLGVA